MRGASGGLTGDATPVLVCDGLHKDFGDIAAVADVGFRILPGETYGLLGPNGAGKTTVISMVCGLLQPDAGSVSLDGHPITVHAVSARRAIGYVPQDLAVYPDLSARENLRFFGRLYGMSGAALRDRVDEVIETIGLAERAGNRVAEYSGGMKRRLNIGIGLLHRPRLLVLDEPTVGVDPQSRNAILESVEQLSAGGMAVLYTTHYMEEAERLCDRVGIIDAGALRAEGTRELLIELVGEHDQVHLTGAGRTRAAADAAAGLARVREATAREDAIDLIVDGARTLLPEILTTVQRAGMRVDGAQVVEPNLEAVFLHLTGKALRDR